MRYGHLRSLCEAWLAILRKQLPAQFALRYACVRHAERKSKLENGWLLIQRYWRQSQLEDELAYEHPFDERPFTFRVAHMYKIVGRTGARLSSANHEISVCLSWGAPSFCSNTLVNRVGCLKDHAADFNDGRTKHKECTTKTASLRASILAGQHIADCQLVLQELRCRMSCAKLHGSRAALQRRRV